jgi:hypothetical protein
MGECLNSGGSGVGLEGLIMSDTVDSMATEVDQQELAQQLLAQTREQGIELVGPDGLLNRLTKNVLETALEAEMDEHLGYGRHDVSGRGSGELPQWHPHPDRYD